MAYERMHEKKWHPYFYEWLANPLDHRSASEFCASVGIELDNLSHFKTRHAEDIAKEVERRRKKFTYEFRTKAMKALDNKMETDTNALRLAFQIIGDLVEKTDSRLELMTPEQKREKVRALLDEIEASKDRTKELAEKVLGEQAGNPENPSGSGTQAG